MKLTETEIKQIAIWALGEDTGISSKTIVSIALGLNEGVVYRWDMPHDVADFGRCYRLINQIPRLAEYLPLVADKCPQWQPLVAIWDELSRLYEADLQNNGRTCYDKIKSLHEECMAAAGYVRMNDIYWVHKSKLQGEE
ncbi:hypothetical protein [Xenorhabdus ishibashii]|uniref:Uncharacterized protein n=1 Tax=Xenorhabdus ishibashii TaxID=1034471 RepID=A0A2D0KCP7_9GAMM|nr:hypothetical protein [Xenorhabdus ishibashii]PHM61224.1 hypothetical protein Xish_00346 [Xenorhabdus ishibashii]